MLRSRTALCALHLVVLALCTGACSVPLAPPEGHTLDLETEAASFYLYHPDDLQHRKASPSEWRGHDFAIGPELAAGNLVTFDTGADGGYRIRLTEGNLTAREKQYRSCSWDFRYRVRHGRVLIDDGESLPSASDDDLDSDLPAMAAQPPAIPANQWFAIPNGDYRVTVSALDWEKEPGAVGPRENATKGALPAYVIQFKTVDQLATIKPATCAPRLEPGPGAVAKFYPVPVDQDFEEDTTEPLPTKCPVVVAPELILVPGFVTSAITVSTVPAARAPIEADPLPEPWPGGPPAYKQVAFVNSVAPSGVGVLGRFGGGSGPEVGEWRVKYHLLRLVTMSEIEKVDKGLVVTITPFVRPKSAVPPGEVEAIKSVFDVYASSNQAYRKAVPHPDYEAARVGSMTSPAAISTILLHHVVMPAETRARLLLLSDAERIRELLALMKTSSSE